ncbi:DUF4190 domain-containing protein [Streptomyces sp. NPDC015346]|uniref:DUF4190 domain-containing protein n=1 Tax=Streptomyces sp. NPDC015346 TaxID=3364954 RepID=UPI0036FC2E0B
MSDNSEQQRGGYDPADPWAPPNRDGVELSKPAAPEPQDRPPVSPVHDQPTMTSMPAAGDGTGELPPPPVAPGGPAATPGAYGYPPAPPAAGATSTYGYPGYPGYSGYGQQGWQGGGGQSNGMGTAAMVLGILAVCLFCLYGVLSLILGVLALIFGIMGRKRVQRGEANNGGQATAGVVLGSIGIALGVAMIGFLVWIFMNAEEFENDGGLNDPFATSLVVENR